MSRQVTIARVWIWKHDTSEQNKRREKNHKTEEEKEKKFFQKNKTLEKMQTKTEKQHRKKKPAARNVKRKLVLKSLSPAFTPTKACYSLFCFIAFEREKRERKRWITGWIIKSNESGGWLFLNARLNLSTTNGKSDDVDGLFFLFTIASRWIETPTTNLI